MTPFTLFASIDPHLSHFLIAISLFGLLFSILYGILSRDLSKDLKKLPEDIPTNNLFDPQGFFDSKTQKSCSRNKSIVVQRLRSNAINCCNC